MLHQNRNRARLGRRAWIVTSLAALAVSLPLAAASVAPADVAPLVAAAPRDVTLVAPSASVHLEPVASGARGSRRQATGSIGGTLLDQSGGTLPGATVTLTNLDTGAQSVTASDALGRFVFRGLQPATYRAVASRPGFKSGTIDVRLTPGAAIQPTLTLGLGSVHETIHVTCGQSSGIVRLLELSARVRETMFPRLYAQGMPAVRVGGAIRQPLKLTDVRPVCPSTLPSAETTIHLVGHIGVNGLIEDAAPAPVAPGSEPPAELTQSALDAVRRWTFAPTLLNGQVVETEIAVDVTFGKS